MRTLVMILNHNLPEWTDRLFEALRPHTAQGYSLSVLDNGSPPEGRSRHTDLQTYDNCFFGGGINYAFSHMLEHPEFEYLLFLNNDLIVHGPRFVTSLVEAADRHQYTMVSPCILQPEVEQNFWPVMHCWGSQLPRETAFIDFTAPLIHRRLIEAVNQFDAALKPGYGIDLYAALVCRDRGWTLAVCDHVPVVHMGSLTLKLGRSSLSREQHHAVAKAAYVDYFRQIGRFEEMERLRWGAKNYRFSPPVLAVDQPARSLQGEPPWRQKCS